jgi:hypothetical protein
MWVILITLNHGGQRFLQVHEDSSGISFKVVCPQDEAATYFHKEAAVNDTAAALLKLNCTDLNIRGVSWILI